MLFVRLRSTVSFRRRTRSRQSSSLAPYLGTREAVVRAMLDLAARSCGSSQTLRLRYLVCRSKVQKSEMA